MKKQLIYQDDKSNKFWTIETKGTSLTVTYGKIGTKSQSLTKEFESEEKCQKEAEKILAEKIKKGYKDDSVEISSKQKSLKKTKKSLNEFVFPFFGAGHASYFEWAEVIVRFIEKPDKEQKDKIIKSAPSPIQPGKNDFNSKILLAGSNQFVNMYIEEAYGNGKPVDSKKNKKDVNVENEEEDPYFYVSNKAAKAFESDIERWLNEINSFCPIEFVLRREDGEADGIKLSNWHKQSLKTISALIERWNNDEYTYKQKEISNFTYALSGIFEYENVDHKKLPEKLVELVFPEKKLKRLLNKSDFNEAIAFIKEHQNNEIVNDLIKDKISQLIKQESFLMVRQMTVFIKDQMDKEDIEYAFLERAEFYENKNDFNKMLDISLESIKIFPESGGIIANIIYSASKSGNPEISKEYIAKKSNDPTVIASFIQTGKLKEANELLIYHLNNKKVLNFDLLQFLFGFYINQKLPDKNTLEKIINASIEYLNENLGQVTLGFMNNFTILLNKTGRQKTTLELLQTFRNSGHKIDCGLWCNYTNASLLTKDIEIISKLINEVTSVFKSNPSTYTKDNSGYIALGNIACMFAQLRNKERMMEYLKLTKKYHPYFNKLKTNSDFNYFKEYWGDPDFIKLFK